MQVVKRDGRKVEFDRGKVKNAIIKAYTDVYNSEIDSYIDEINKVTEQMLNDMINGEQIMLNHSKIGLLIVEVIDN